MQANPQERKHAGNTALYIVVFISGMTTLAVELSASRLLGSVYGTSNLIWANVIGLMLLYLTVGYFIGGRWADKSPFRTTLYQIIIWGAFLSALIPIVARPVLVTAAQAVFGAEAALALGSFISVLVLFSIPVTLLGTVSPFAIRLAVNAVGESGKIAGQIYAISTLGSLIGTFLPTLFLIPEIGTTQTFLLFAGILYTTSIIILAQEDIKKALRWLWMPLVIIVLYLALVNGPLRPPTEGVKLLYDDESAYNYIQVQEDAKGYRYLYLNEGQGIHSQWHPTEIAYNRTWDYFLAAPYFNEPPFTPTQVRSMLIVGLATGTIARQHIAVYGNIPIDGIEIDPDIITVGAQFFDMNAEHMPSLTVYAQDGRYILNQLSKRYDVIAIDAYRPPYIPWHLTTIEFFQEVRQHLDADGVLAINVGRTNTDRRLVDALTSTLLHVYPTVHAIDVPASFNTILVATVQPTRSENLEANVALLTSDTHPLLQTTLTRATQAIVPVQLSNIIFTDDKAPVETLIDSLVINFLLYGNTDLLR